MTSATKRSRRSSERSSPTRCGSRTSIGAQKPTRTRHAVDRVCGLHTSWPSYCRVCHLIQCCRSPTPPHPRHHPGHSFFEDSFEKIHQVSGSFPHKYEDVASSIGVRKCSHLAIPGTVVYRRPPSRLLGCSWRVSNWHSTLTLSRITSDATVTSIEGGYGPRWSCSRPRPPGLPTANKRGTRYNTPTRLSNHGS